VETDSQSLLDEQCESSTHNPALAYTCSNCRFLSLTCGDGKIDAGEECDKGAKNSSTKDAPCRPNCSLSRCGDGTLDSPESCDDGNRLAGDGCDRFCKEEQDAQELQDTQDTIIASEDISLNSGQFQFSNTQYIGNQQQVGFPQYPNYNQLPYQLPLANIRLLIQSQGPIGDTGPAAVAVIGAGAAAGFGWIRRKRR
jgi:cysteine-rich repeat protein